MPGTLPSLNRAVVDAAVRLGFALGARCRPQPSRLPLEPRNCSVTGRRRVSCALSVILSGSRQALHARRAALRVGRAELPCDAHSPPTIGATHRGHGQHAVHVRPEALLLPRPAPRVPDHAAEEPDPHRRRSGGASLPPLPSRLTARRVAAPVLQPTPALCTSGALPLIQRSSCRRTPRRAPRSSSPAPSGSRGYKSRWTRGRRSTARRPRSPLALHRPAHLIERYRRIYAQRR